ncbi:MAG: hypothetical protein PHE33_03125 [Bacteroidales bacterium]|nr:hypothetical protein [Bacteroidales bacterium]
MKTIKVIFITLFIALILTFSLQNMDSLTIHFFNWTLTLPVFVSAIAIYILGALTGGLLFSLLKKISKNTDTQ